MQAYFPCTHLLVKGSYTLKLLFLYLCMNTIVDDCFKNIFLTDDNINYMVDGNAAELVLKSLKTHVKVNNLYHVMFHMVIISCGF